MTDREAFWAGRGVGSTCRWGSEQQTPSIVNRVVLQDEQVLGIGGQTSPVNVDRIHRPRASVTARARRGDGPEAGGAWRPRTDEGRVAIERAVDRAMAVLRQGV